MANDKIKILITGTNSYIGTSFEKWLNNYEGCYIVETIDVKEPNWKEKNFNGYDAVLHVAGIAHVSTDPNLESLYYKVNRDLAIEIAWKAKEAGIKQFIFMSSLIVYGDNHTIITKDTLPDPKNFYGLSKLQAEAGILKLVSTEFKTAVIRSPMVYGKGSKGNYNKLSLIARKCPIFPDYDNKRSMIHINNLCEFIKLLIDNRDNGVFYPQNREYVRTSHLVKAIAESHGKQIKLVKIFNPLISLLIGRLDIITKVFGDSFYTQELSRYKQNYCIRDFNESIRMTEQ